MIKDGEVIIIDEFTGRLMIGRRYSGGLHQAIEAKENVEVKRESKTLATVTFQNYFRMFDKLAGMTGTAKTEEEEFFQIYGLNTIVIPTNKTCVRTDSPDIIYKTQKGKYMAAVQKIKELHKKGQPVLVGTVSVEKSEIISQLLKLEGVPHNVLNAKHHEREAEIITDAGKKGSVTIATNMAGRGTDIKLGEGVTDLGGLFILGTERHESRRIDNQLRGRSGRQGDPGASSFLVSMDDDLMRLFGGDRMKKMMDMLNVPEDMPIENGMISRSIENAQKKVEGHHFDIRKHLVEYDDVMNIHREIIYARRKKILLKEDVKEDILEMIKEFTESVVRNHTEARPRKEWDIEAIFNGITSISQDEENPLKIETLEEIENQDDLIEIVAKYLTDIYEKRENSIPDPAILRAIEKAVILRTNDTLWMEHIDEMSHLRENVAFTGYAQKDPLVEYKTQAFVMFNEMIATIKMKTIETLFKIDLRSAIPERMMPKEVKVMRTNEDQISATLSGAKNMNQENPVLVKANANLHQQAKSEKIGRNDPCPCGSGKKYKKCCGQNA